MSVSIAHQNATPSRTRDKGWLRERVTNIIASDQIKTKRLPQAIKNTQQKMAMRRLLTHGTPIHVIG